MPSRVGYVVVSTHSFPYQVPGEHLRNWATQSFSYLMKSSG